MRESPGDLCNIASMTFCHLLGQKPAKCDISIIFENMSESFVDCATASTDLCGGLMEMRMYAHLEHYIALESAP
jgi:hypothetical protein